MQKEEGEQLDGLKEHVIVVGFGPCGQIVSDGLHREGHGVSVIELNRKNRDEARRRGFHAELGDATQSEVLEHACLKAARAIVITLPDNRATLGIIDHVNATAPHVLIIARSRYHILSQDYENAGAAEVVDEELQVGHELSAAAIRHLGSAHSQGSIA